MERMSHVDAPEALDELGAHVSVAGGVEHAPERARAIGSVTLQCFTKQANRWAEPTVEPARAARWDEAVLDQSIRTAGSHDSYLINLASPDPDLWARSLASFESELRRCEALSLDFLVTHPGNATDGDRASGISRNADGITRAMESVPGATRVLLELTAGAGSTVGGRLEDLSAILLEIPEPHRSRVGVCFDTCHAYSAGYDLVGEYEQVWAHFENLLGLDRLGLFHLNDSKHPFGSRKDRHEHIGQGSLGELPFQRIMTDPRFSEIPKVLETPKGEDDLVTLDRMNLARLRGYREAGTD
jgi:deoxyribonuclease IV